MKILLKSLRQYRKSTIWTIVLSTAEVLLEIMIPLLMADLIDQGIDQGNMSAVEKYGLALLFLALLELAAGVFSARTAAKASAGFAANLREDMYDNAQTFAFSNIDKFSTASIVTRLTTDMTNVQNAWQMLIRMAIRGPLMLIFSMAVSFSISADIAWIFLLMIPILGVLLFLIVKKVNPIFSSVFHTYDTLNNVVQENVRGIRVVKSFHQEDQQTGLFHKISAKICEEFSKGEKLLALNTPLMQLCMYTCMILIS